MEHKDISLSDVHGSIEPSEHKSIWKKIGAFFGPAYLVSVGYMDPGNWATDLAGGSKFGYTLIWVLLMSNLMALLLQSLSARLGVVAGRDLAQANRDTYPTWVNVPLYILAELAIAACDLAEVLGMAIGLQLLLGIDLLYGVLITVLDTFLLLYLQRLGMRKMEAFIISLVAIIAGCFLLELVLAKPDLGAVAKGFVPRLPNDEALYISIGIIGATVMPHNLYLHSALVQTRKVKRDRKSIKEAIRMNFLDSSIALNMAFFVNAGILILGAAAFHYTGRTDIADLQEAHTLLEPILGTSMAPILFAVALIAAGQSSTITGTLAGQIVMEGYLNLRINPLLRRFISRMLAIIPAVAVILIAGESKIMDLLVFSQVFLSIQLGFAIIPLIYFVSDKDRMGEFAIKPIVQILAWLIALIIIVLNLKMVYNELQQWWVATDSVALHFLLILAGLLFVALLIITMVVPVWNKRRARAFDLHTPRTELKPVEVKQYDTIALALDFSDKDDAVIANAIQQGHDNTLYLLIHVVESASAKMFGKEARDWESRKDQEQLDTYVQLLQEKNLHAQSALGFNHRAHAIAELCKAHHADLLVVGGHGHKGFKDWWYGETINQLRHKVEIPVLIVR